MQKKSKTMEGRSVIIHITGAPEREKFNRGENTHNFWKQGLIDKTTEAGDSNESLK